MRVEGGIGQVAAYESDRTEEKVILMALREWFISVELDF